jgi:hypothetical protein
MSARVSRCCAASARAVRIAGRDTWLSPVRTCPDRVA